MVALALPLPKFVPSGEREQVVALAAGEWQPRRKRSATRLVLELAGEMTVGPDAGARGVLLDSPLEQLHIKARMTNGHRNTRHC